ncbi:MAG: ABC transporter substrate-binding protein [Dehalococcoidia bacterium]
MPEGTYWSRRKFGRRTALRGAGVAFAGLAGAALFGCGGDDEEATATAAPTEAGSATATTATGDGSTPVPADQVRIAPGAYLDSIPPTPAEMNPAVNARYGGTLMARYLDPPHMDFNRTLSCTVNSTMDFTKNKLTRAQFGPMADWRRVNVEPDLAESWEINADATQFTFHLRQGAKFHNVEPTNGREFVAEDARLSIERYQAGGTQKDVWSVVTSVEMPDDYTLVVSLDQPLADFPRNIAAWSHIDAREMLEDQDFLKEHAVGTGPFIQEEWTKKERSVFARNPEYFEAGLPYLDKVITPVQNDTAAQRAGYITDNFVYWSGRDEPDAESMLSQAKDSVYLKYESVVGANTEGFHFQMANPIFQDERIRRAFPLAIDWVEWDLARYAGEGGGYVRSPIPWPYLYDARPKHGEQGQWYMFDPAQARQLLQAAGYSEDNRLEVDFPAWYQREQYAQIMIPMLVENLPEVKANFREVDNPTAVTMLNDRNFDDTMNITWGPPVYSVDQAVFPWYHSQGGLNHNNVNDATMDDLVTKQRAEQNPEAQTELWRQIEDRIFDQVWEVFFPGTAINRIFWHNYMVNFRPHGIASVLSCYGDGKARSIWLDEGAPNTAVGPTFIPDGTAL